MNLSGGAVYNHYLARQMDRSKIDLEQEIEEWDNKSLVGKIISCFSLIEDPELRYRATKDILEARENPNGETANKINWKLDSYRKELSER